METLELPSLPKKTQISSSNFTNSFKQFILIRTPKVKSQISD